MSDDTKQYNTSTVADWAEQQKAVWGTKDPEVWTRVIDRIKATEPAMLADVQQAMENGAPAHTIAWICVNYVLRGRAYSGD